MVPLWGAGHDHQVDVPINKRRGFYRDSAGAYTSMGTFGGTESSTSSINDHGVAVGWAHNLLDNTVAVSWQPGVIMGSLNVGGVDSWARDINNDGNIIGGVDDGVNPVSGFIIDQGTQYNLPSVFAGEDVVPMAINNHGLAVGYSTGIGSSHPIVWKPNRNAFDLQTLIPAGSGWVLSQASDVNDMGEITGFGYLNGAKRGFRMTPDVDFPLFSGLQPAIAASSHSKLYAAKATPGAVVHFIWGTTPGTSIYGGVQVDMADPALIAVATADSEGRVEMPSFLHGSFAGTTILTQAIDKTTGEVSRLHSQAIQ